MIKLIYEVAVVDNFGEEDEKVIKSQKLTDFKKALAEFHKIAGRYKYCSEVFYDGEIVPYERLCFVGKKYDRAVFLNEVGWIDDNGEHYYSKNNYK